jgi:hypothetical protein
MPNATKTPAALAGASAESVRQLNHATFRPGGNGWKYPSDAYSVVGGLVMTVHALPQTLDQLGSLLSGLAANGHLGSDRGTADQDLSTALAALEDAREAADKFGRALSRVHSAVGPMSYRN